MGNPVRFILTQGQSSEYDQAESLIEGFKADFVLADRGYDSNRLIELIRASGATAVIPARKNRLEERDYDKVIYKERNLVERLFQKLKHYRRIATRYERLARNYIASARTKTSKLSHPALLVSDVRQLNKPFASALAGSLTATD